MATQKQKFQEIANRGLQDKLDPTARAKFNEAVRRGLITVEPTTQPPPELGSNEDVPTPENLAIPNTPEPKRSLMDSIVGGGEAALSMATAATGGALGYLSSAPDAALNEITGNKENGAGFDNASAMSANLTYSPRTQAGKDYVKSITEAVSTLPPILGAGPIAGLTTKNPLNRRALISDEIASGNINVGNIVKSLNEDGKLITNKNVKTAIKLMGDDEAGTTIAINFEKMNNATRVQVNKMLDVISANKKSGDPVDAMNNRPSAVIGESLADRAIALNNKKNKASAAIGEIINGDLGVAKVSVADARDKFITALAESDVIVGRTESGSLVADSTKTLTNIDEVIKGSKLNNILGRIESGEMTAKEAHKIKRNLREMVTFDPTKPGGVKVSTEIEKAVKALASELGDSVSKISPGYKKANQTMANSLDALKKADKMLGNNLMIGDDLATLKFGALSKRIGTNLASRESVLDLVRSLDDSLGKRRPKDNIERQVSALSDLEKIFKLESAQAPNGFQSRVGQGVTEGVISSGVPVREIIGAATDQFKKMSKLDFDDKIKALRLLSKPKNTQTKKGQK